MARFLSFALALLFALCATVFSQQVRDVRSLPQGKAQHILMPSICEPDTGENQDTLRYEDPRSLPNFVVRPNSFGDHYCDVRFTALYYPVYLLEAHIALYDMDGDAGEPGLNLVLFESGDKLGVPGYPTDAVDSVKVPFENLVLSGDSLVWNVINLRPMQVGFWGPIDFHIAVEPILGDTLDTLAVFVDSGRYTLTTRSYTLADGEWKNLKDDLEMLPFNFAIHALICPEMPVDWDAPRDLSPGRQPSTILLNPAFPNPFNDRTTINFSVVPGKPYTVGLFDRQGRRLAILDRGVGAESKSLSLNGRDLSSGVYFLQVSCPGETRSTELHYLR